jgi:hypothetical protein
MIKVENKANAIKILVIRWLGDKMGKIPENMDGIGESWLASRIVTDDYRLCNGLTEPGSPELTPQVGLSLPSHGRRALASS